MDEGQGEVSDREIEDFVAKREREARQSIAYMRFQWIVTATMPAHVRHEHYSTRAIANALADLYRIDPACLPPDLAMATEEYLQWHLPIGVPASAPLWLHYRTEEEA
jgi:hypothetical protein